jgi:kinetochore protein Mis12/MTW1
VLYKCTDSLESGLSSADPGVLGFASRYAAESRQPALDEDGKPVYNEAKLEIEEGILKLETLMEAAVDKNFDRLEIWALRNVLCLPADVADWVRLGHYEVSARNTLCNDKHDTKPLDRTIGCSILALT